MVINKKKFKGINGISIFKEDAQGYDENVTSVRLTEANLLDPYVIHDFININNGFIFINCDTPEIAENLFELIDNVITYGRPIEDAIDNTIKNIEESFKF